MPALKAQTLHPLDQLEDLLEKEFAGATCLAFQSRLWTGDLAQREVLEKWVAESSRRCLALVSAEPQKMMEQFGEWQRHLPLEFWAPEDVPGKIQFLTEPSAVGGG